MVQADKKYHGTVTGGEWIESQSGSLGFQVFLKCEDGETSYTIWITNKNRDRAEKVFNEALGVSSDKLANAAYVENKLTIDITGHEVTFVTEEEIYKNKSRVKVAWLFKRSATSGGNPAKAAASFFGKPKGTLMPEITDEDVPF
jgi:hypothetical protein